MRFTLFTIVILFTVSLFGAEIRFRSEPVRCESTVVTLGEIAEIVPDEGESIERFRHIVLFPAPGVEGRRTLTRTELRDNLASRGISTLDHRIGGSDKVTLIGHNNPVKETINANKGRTISSKQRTEIEAKVKDAIVFHLNRSIGNKNGMIAKNPWNVQVRLDMNQLKSFAFNGSIQGVRGGEAPWIGRQSFKLELEGIDPVTNRRMIVPVDADVNLPPEVVVLRRSVSRGKIVTAGDIELQARSDVRGTDYFASPEEVIGKEMRAQGREGSILLSNMLREPILVQRNSPVTVHARVGGIMLRTEGIALEDGAKGDLISIQRRDNRKQTFHASVTEIGTVEVFASSDISI